MHDARNYFPVSGFQYTVRNVRLQIDGFGTVQTGMKSGADGKTQFTIHTVRLHTDSSVRLAHAKSASAEHLNIFNAMILSGGSAGRMGVALFMEHVTLGD